MPEVCSEEDVEDGLEFLLGTVGLCDDYDDDDDDRNIKHNDNDDNDNDNNSNDNDNDNNNNNNNEHNDDYNNTVVTMTIMIITIMINCYYFIQGLCLAFLLIARRTKYVICVVLILASSQKF